MSTIFTKIINKKVDAFIVAETDEFIAFLDTNPVTGGHTLVVPKTEVDYIFDLPDDLLSRMALFSKSVAAILKEKLNKKRVVIAVYGFEVPHAHIHLIPADDQKDTDFSKKQQPSAGELSKIHQIITR